VVKLLDIELEDERAERARRSHASAITELQTGPLAGAKVIAGISLPDGELRTVAHKLGRAPRWVGVSVVRGASTAGVITETRGGQYNASQLLALTASGYGATITVDLLVLP
jgi:hypothetical protein